MQGSFRLKVLLSFTGSESADKNVIRPKALIIIKRGICYFRLEIERGLDKNFVEEPKINEALHESSDVKIK